MSERKKFLVALVCWGLTLLGATHMMKSEAQCRNHGGIPAIAYGCIAAKP